MRARSHLLECKYGSVVFDEAHKARRRGGPGPKKDEPENLLDFMLRIGSRDLRLDHNDLYNIALYLLFVPPNDLR